MQLSKPTKKRKINVIEYTQSSRKANLLTKRGKQAQTAALNINLKTINKNELLKMQILSQDNQEKNIIANYIIEKANFTTTRKLFGVQRTQYSPLSHKRILCYMQDFYESKRFVQNILNNDNMDFPNKLILLKFLQKIRASAIDPKKHTNWKQRF